MMYATKLKMQQGCRHSQNLLEIDSIYLDKGCSNPGFYKKAVLYDFLKENPGTIAVGIYPCPKVIPAISPNGEKYVKSSPNDYTHDNLLDLPRE